MLHNSKEVFCLKVTKPNRELYWKQNMDDKSSNEYMVFTFKISILCTIYSGHRPFLGMYADILRSFVGYPGSLLHPPRLSTSRMSPCVYVYLSSFIFRPPTGMLSG